MAIWGRVVNSLALVKSYASRIPGFTTRPIRLNRDHPSASFALTREGQTINLLVGGKEYSASRSQDRILICRTKTEFDQIGTWLDKGKIVKLDELEFLRKGDRIFVGYAAAEVNPPSPPLRLLPSLPSSVPSVGVPPIPRGLDGRPVDRTAYEEITNVPVLQHGDILPGHHFVLGDFSTYDRELLTVNIGQNSALHPLLEAAEKIGRETSKTQADKIGEIIALVKTVAPSRPEFFQAGKVETLGFFAQGQGCCRHIAATLQLTLQKAGLTSRYVRGNFLNGWHAWVEIDVDNNGSFAYIADLSMDIIGSRGEITRTATHSSYTVTSRVEGTRLPGGVFPWEYQRIDEGAVVWRPKPIQPARFTSTLPYFSVVKPQVAG